MRGPEGHEPHNTGEHQKRKRESHDRGLPESPLVPEDPGEGVRGEEIQTERVKLNNTEVKDHM